MVKESNIMTMEMYMMENGLMIKEKDMELCHFKIKNNIEEIGKMMR